MTKYFSNGLSLGTEGITIISVKADLNFHGNIARIVVDSIHGIETRSSFSLGLFLFYSQSSPVLGVMCTVLIKKVRGDVFR